MGRSASLRLVAWTLLTGVVCPLLVLGQVTPPAAATEEAAAPPAPKPEELTIEQRGDLLMARKMFREAIDVYSTGLKQPGNWVLYNKIGICYQHLMNYKAARKNYQEALKRNRKYGEAQNNIGTTYYAEKNYRRAAQEYEKALKLNPYSATVYSNLGTALYARKRYDEAMQAYRKAIELDPDVFEVRGTAGSILQERSVEELARFHYYMAKTYAQAGRNELALRYIRRSLEEGFPEKKKYLEDPEFAALQELPEFKELMTMEIRVL